MSEIKETERRQRVLYNEVIPGASKIISCAVAIAYLIIVKVIGAPFNAASVFFDLGKDMPFHSLNSHVDMLNNVLKLSFVLVLLIELSALIIKLLSKGRSQWLKTSVIFEVIGDLGAGCTMIYYFMVLRRFCIKPAGIDSLIIFYGLAVLFYLGFGIYKSILIAKDKIKLPGIKVKAISAVLLTGLILSCAKPLPEIIKQQSYDLYLKDKFAVNNECMTQAMNNLSSAVSIDDCLYCIRKTGEEEYGILRVSADGESEVLDTAPYIAEGSLVNYGNVIYYLKFDSWWNIGSGYKPESPYHEFNLCAMDISTGIVTMNTADELPSEFSDSLRNATLLGIRDDKLYFMSWSSKTLLDIEIYRLDLNNGVPDMSSAELYAWNLNLDQMIGYPVVAERAYSGLIHEHCNFDRLTYGDFSYALEGSGNGRLNLYRSGESDIREGVPYAVDYNVYGDKLYYIVYNEETQEIEAYYSNLDLTDPVLIGTVPEYHIPRENIFYFDEKIAVSDSFVVLTNDTRVTVFPL